MIEGEKRNAKPEVPWHTQVVQLRVPIHDSKLGYLQRALTPRVKLSGVPAYFIEGLHLMAHLF